MNVYTVSFFGHKEVSQPFLVEERLKNIIEDIINNKEYAEFLVGRDGEFDQIVSSVIRRTAKRFACSNTTLVLVLPYMRAEYRDNEQSFHDYYDEVEVCTESSMAHFKAAIQIRNRSMIDRSNLVVCCIERKSGGAYKTIQYAMQQRHKIVNVAENDIIAES